MAVYLLGGESHDVDTEDVAIKANEIAPGRFAWRKHHDQINLEVIRVYLSDAKKPEKGAYLVGSGNEGWLLTEKGLSFARSNAAKLKNADLARTALSQKDQRIRKLEKSRMLSTSAFEKFIAGRSDTVTQQEAEAFFRLDNYIVGKARERKLVRTLNAFGQDSELGEAVRELAKRVRTRGEEE